ncbi:MAG: carbohydrate porin [Polyangiales bacterium]
MRQIGAAVGCVLVLCSTVRADEFATSPARPGYEAADRILDFARRTELEEHGLKLEGTYAFEMFAAPQLDDRLTNGGLFMLELDVDFSLLAYRRLGALRISTASTHGGSPSDELMDVHGVSGNTAPEDNRIFEAWYEQPFGPLVVRAGILAVDQEYNYADPTSTLLGATFGITSQFSYNVGGPTYPVGTPGVSARYEDGPVLLQAAIYDGAQTNTRGIPTDLGPSSLVLAEATWNRDLGVGAWRHSDKGSGVYATLDHKLDDFVEAFTRIGLSPRGVKTYVDAGVRIGPGPLRPEDFVSVGMAFAQLDEGDQILIEATYEAQVGWLTIQPAMQLMMMRERSVGIVATRMTVVF